MNLAQKGVYAILRVQENKVSVVGLFESLCYALPWKGSHDEGCLIYDVIQGRILYYKTYVPWHHWTPARGAGTQCPMEEVYRYRQKKKPCFIGE